ncbi:MAG: phenylalanine--tRNA ligase subunit beta [Candidatus Micrarchaeia archaeon]|jgi:phenylalanyl-tRNA synthetase beta chain
MAIVETKIPELKKFAGHDAAKMNGEQLAHAISMMGLPVDKHDSETVFTEVSPNRPDCYSVEGLGRALQSFLGTKPGLREYSALPAKISLKVEQSAKSASRPVIAAAVARNVKMDGDLVKSLMQVQEKLHDTLGRKRRKVAIGVYDLSKLSPPFTYKAVKPKDAKFVPLDTKIEMDLEEILLEHPKGVGYAKLLEGEKTYPLIVDSTGQVLSFPPIINGQSSRVTEQTRDLFIESTGTSLGAQSDALNILCCMLADHGAKIEQVEITGSEKITTPDLSARKAETSVAAIEKLLGISVSAKDACLLFEKMGYDAKADAKGGISLRAPCYRNDLLHEVDLIEDVGIAYGFEKLHGTGMRFSTIGEKHPKEAFVDKVRAIMIGLGFQDCITFMLTNENREYKKMLCREEPRVEIANPLTEETTMLRSTLLPSLIGVLENNKGQKYPQKMFEAGEVLVLDAKSETGARTVKKLCVVACHKDANLAEMKSALEALFRELGERLEISQGLDDQKPFFIEGRSAGIKAQSSKGAKYSGFFGEIHPQVLENFGLLMPVAALEIWLED